MLLFSWVAPVASNHCYTAKLNYESPSVGPVPTGRGRECPVGTGPTMIDSSTANWTVLLTRINGRMELWTSDTAGWTITVGRSTGRTGD